MENNGFGHTGALNSFPDAESHQEAGSHGNHPPRFQCAFALQQSFGTKTIVPSSVKVNAKLEAAYGPLTAGARHSTAPRNHDDRTQPAEGGMPQMSMG